MALKSLLNNYINLNINDCNLSQNAFVMNTTVISNNKTKMVNESLQVFGNNPFSFEIGRMTFVWVHYIFTIGMIFVGITSSIPCRESGRVISTSVLCFIAFTEVLLCLAYNICEGIVLLDICEDINALNPASPLPQYRLGLEYYINPLSPSALSLANSKYNTVGISLTCKNFVEYLWNNCNVHIFGLMSHRRLCVGAFNQLMIVVGAVVGLTIGSLMIVIMYNRMRQLLLKREIEASKKKGIDAFGSLSMMNSYMM